MTKKKTTTRPFEEQARIAAAIMQSVKLSACARNYVISFTVGRDGALSERAPYTWNNLVVLIKDHTDTVRLAVTVDLDDPREEDIQQLIFAGLLPGNFNVNDYKEDQR